MTIDLRCWTLAGFISAGLVLSGSAGAKEWNLTAGASHPPIIPWVATIKNHVVPESNKRLKAMGKPDTIKWTEAYAGALYKFTETLEGVGDGLADIGWVGTLWEPVKMPLHNVTFYAPFATGDVFHLMEIQEEMETTIPAFRAEWTRQNTVYLGAQVADTYHLITNFPIRTVEDLEGKKLMSPGAVANWLKGTGAIGIDGGLPVYYNNIKTGVADGAIVITTGMLPFKLHEVAPYITKVDLGGPISGGLAMNKDTWDSLPDYMQEMFRQLGKEYAEIQTKIVKANAEKFLTTMEEQGAKVSELPAAERKKWVDGLPDLAGDWARANGEAGAQVLKSFMDGVRERGGEPARQWDQGIM